MVFLLFHLSMGSIKFVHCIFACKFTMNQPNLGKCNYHGSYGYRYSLSLVPLPRKLLTTWASLVNFNLIFLQFPEKLTSLLGRVGPNPRYCIWCIYVWFPLDPKKRPFEFDFVEFSFTSPTRNTQPWNMSFNPGSQWGNNHHYLTKASLLTLHTPLWTLRAFWENLSCPFTFFKTKTQASEKKQQNMIVL